MLKIMLVLGLSGCMSITHATVRPSKDQCIPPVLIAGDVVLGAATTYTGVLVHEPVVAVEGGVYLGLATLMMFAQMAECEWLQ
jgi:hypothetical protein